MAELILHTFEWVPEMPRGYVRDLRVRWALEEAGLPYRVEGVPFRERNAEHFSHQPFGQAILLHLGNRSEKLMPTEPRGRSEALEWLFAALNSVEAVSLPWSFFVFSGFNKGDTPGWKRLDEWLEMRLGHIDPVLVT